MLETLKRALEKTPLGPDHRNAVLKAMTPHGYASDALLRLFDLSSDLLVIAGFDGRFRRVNPAFARALGRTAEALTSTSFFDFLHPNDVEITRSKLEKLKAGLDVVRFENRWKAQDGTWRRLSWICPAPPEGTKDLFALATVVPDPA